MAFFDNRHWLLSHIRNSFISSDGTGMCEIVIVDDFPKDSDIFSAVEMYPREEESEEEEDEELSNSLDNGGWDSDRRIGGTESEREKKKGGGVEAEPSVEREEERPLGQVPQNLTPHTFERKDISKRSKTAVRSLLAQELEKCSRLPKNPFTEYAKFDGSYQMGVPTRTYKIFLTMLPRPSSDYPIKVCILSMAKVSDLIGFACWKYVTQNPHSSFKFRESVDEYALYIAEDNGEVDWDFSSLDPRETVGKFGLPYLAMVDMSAEDVPREAAKTIPYPEVPAEFPDVNSAAAAEQFNVDLSAMESLLHQTFRVVLLYKMRSKAEVLLGISGDKVEIYPLLPVSSKAGSGKPWHQKPQTFDVNRVVSCHVLEVKTSGRAVFRIVIHADGSGDSTPSPAHQAVYKNHDFEADQEAAEEISRKLNNILELKPGELRREYLAHKHKKNVKRGNFNLWPL